MSHSKSAKYCPGSHGTLCWEQHLVCLSGHSGDLRRVGLFYVVMPTIRTTTRDIVLIFS